VFRRGLKTRVLSLDNLPDFPKITPAELSALKLDHASARQFERRFLWAYLVAVTIAFGIPAGLALLHYTGIVGDRSLGLAIVPGILVSGIVALVTHHRMMRTLPTNAKTGVRLAAFVLRHLNESDRYEIAYVDRESGTYFTRVFLERGGA
jgi:hypothetical protein